MTTTELKNIAKENQLEVIFHENKYDHVISGFKNYDQAVEFTEKYKGEICVIDMPSNNEFFTEFYLIDGKTDFHFFSAFMNEEIEDVKEYFSQGEYIYFDNSSVEDFQEVDIEQTSDWMREEGKSEKEIEEFLNEMNDIKKQIEELADNEIMVKNTRQGNFFKVIARFEKDYSNEKTNTLTRLAVML